MGLRSSTGHLLLLQEHHPCAAQPAPFHSREKVLEKVLHLFPGAFPVFSNQCSTLIHLYILQPLPAPAPAPHSFPPAPSHTGSC